MNSSRGLKAWASRLFHRSYDVIALWHRALGFAGIFGLRFIGPKSIRFAISLTPKS